MNTYRKKTAIWGTLRRVLIVLIIALTAISFLPGPAAGVGDIPAAGTIPHSGAVDVQAPGPAPPQGRDRPSSSPDLPPGATEEWWADVQTYIRQDILGLSPTPDWTATGENDGNCFGLSVATAGDVNGDGYDDVIVGALYYAYPSGNEQGKAYVYHGSSGGLSSTPDWTATGENDWDRFGNSVATAGDVNGDGYDDIIVGALYYRNDQGKAYVYHGSSGGLSSTPDWTATGENDGEDFGWSVARAGDVNGDGFADVIVGAYPYPSGYCRGRAYVYHGSSGGLSSTPDWTATGENDGDYFGNSVATAGDVNGDGFADVIVGARRYRNDQGKAYVYHGSSGGLSSTPDWTATGENDHDEFGFSVATAGDVNGDGYTDVIVGAFDYDNGETDEGAAFVYHGSGAGLSTVPDWTATGENNGDFFGFSVAVAGDVNGDGYADVIVGADGYPSGGWQGKGKAYVYHGTSSGLSTIPDWTATGENDGDRFGWSVATVGDVNGDGYADVIVGALCYPSGNEQGKAYVYHGTACVPVSGVSISGPALLPAGISGLYSTTYTPPSATLPVTVTWSNAVVGPTAAYSWTVTGTYTLAATATNNCGQARDTFTVTVFCQTVEGVEVEGPRALLVGQVGTYYATAEPITASRPLTFTWDSGTVDDTATYSWPATGTYTLTVTATNVCGGVQMASLQVEVLEEWPFSVYLPLVVRE